jgi:hypothetical protein
VDSTRLYPVIYGSAAPVATPSGQVRRFYHCPAGLSDGSPSRYVFRWRPTNRSEESAISSPFSRVGIFCTSSKHLAFVNEICAHCFPKDPPARIYVCVPEWTGPFDIEIDCIAMI